MSIHSGLITLEVEFLFKSWVFFFQRVFDSLIFFLKLMSMISFRTGRKMFFVRLLRSDETELTSCRKMLKNHSACLCRAFLEVLEFDGLKRLSVCLCVSILVYKVEVWGVLSVCLCVTVLVYQVEGWSSRVHESNSCMCACFSLYNLCVYVYVHVCVLECVRKEKKKMRELVLI